MLPQYGEKHEHNSLITPSRMLEHRRQYGRLPSSTPPKTIICCFQGRFVKETLDTMAHRQCDGCFSKLFYLTDYPSTAIAELASGAPAAVAKMEEFIAWGVTEFISIGVAGSLQSKAGIGDLIVCDKAVRDEGTSYHYLPPTKYIHAPRRMTNKLINLLKKAELPHLIGTSWTTDSFYRQTAEEVKHFQKENVLTVEMETAALFALAHFYQVDLGTLLVIGDSHDGELWQPHLEDERPRKGLRSLLNIALEASKQ